MPDPREGEDREAFLDRCMADAEARAGFPDAAQRFAFCSSKVGKRAVALSGRVTKLDTERRIAYGWFSVIEEGGRPVVDTQGDAIKAETLLDAVHDFVLDSRAGRVMHAGRRVADVVESVVFTKDVQQALGIDLGRVGWFGAMKFRDDATWARVKSGELAAFSIGGTGRRVPSGAGV